ncbi:MAG: sensor histidine kinase [Solirubrobacteraceae bacterium]
MNAVNVLTRRSCPINWRLVDVIVASALVCVSVFAEASRHAGAAEFVAIAAAAATVGRRRQAPAKACLVALVGGVIVFGHPRASGQAADFGIPQLVLALDYYVLGRRCAERGWEPPTVVVLAISVPVAAIGVGFSDLVTLIVRVAFFFALPFAAGRAIANRGAMTAERKRLEREQRERARQAAGEERTRVARELHDIVAHSVSVMVIHAVAAREVAEQNRDVAREALRTVQSCGREALSEMRRMIGVLRRGELEPIDNSEPGLSMLGALVDRARASGLEVELRAEGEPRRLSPGVDLGAAPDRWRPLPSDCMRQGSSRLPLESTVLGFSYFALGDTNPRSGPSNTFPQAIKATAVRSRPAAGSLPTRQSAKDALPACQ